MQFPLTAPTQVGTGCTEDMYSFTQIQLHSYQVHMISFQWDLYQRSLLYLSGTTIRLRVGLYHPFWCALPVGRNKPIRVERIYLQYCSLWMDGSTLFILCDSFVLCMVWPCSHRVLDPLTTFGSCSQVSFLRGNTAERPNWNKGKDYLNPVQV